jgi:PleD family two-component response regulator
LSRVTNRLPAALGAILFDILFARGQWSDMAGPGFRYRILVVDDDPAIREASALILVTAGYEVATSEDGFSALIRLRSVLPDLIISDLRGSNMSGFELLSIIRRRFP